MSIDSQYSDPSANPVRAARRDRPMRYRGRAWTVAVESGVAGLRARLAAIEQRPRDLRSGSEAEFLAICQGVRDLLDKAERAARGQHAEHRAVRSWWHGDRIEAAFLNLHLAEAQFARVLDDDEVDAEVPEAVARTEASLSRDDPMRDYARQLLGMQPGRTKRTLLSKTIQVGHDAADRVHTRLRNFRNILLVTTLLLVVLVLSFVVFVSLSPESVPLCFEPAGLKPACPTGEGKVPSSLDVVVVAMLGLLGGSLAGAVSIRNLRGTSTPYDVPVALALLKVPAGALTALGALVAIRGEFVPGLSALDNQEQVLAYALVFGYAQQLLTGLIDKKALGLLDSVPGKDPEQSRPPWLSQPPPSPAPVQNGRVRGLRGVISQKAGQSGR
jgi:hypothetical protein